MKLNFTNEHTLASNIKSFYLFAERNLSAHIASIKGFTDSASWATFVGEFSFGKALNRRVSIPKVHTETGLKSRVVNKGFGHYLMPKPVSPTPQDIQTVFHKQEYLMSEKHKRVNFDRKQLLDASRVVFRHIFWNDKKFSALTNEQSADHLNFPSSSGFPYYQRKGKVKSQLLNDSKSIPFDVWKFFPTMRGLRCQLKLDGFLSVKPRIIYPYPGNITLLELKYVKPLIDYFTSNDSSYITGKIGSFIGNKIMSLGTRYKFNYSTDVSGFDQNMPNELIIASFAVIRSAFHLTRDQAVEFENLFLYFVSSPICGYVGQQKKKAICKKSGIPSGTCFTNLVGTLCHLILLAYYDIDWFKNNSSMICGDDNLFFSNARYSSSQLDSIYAPWGLELNKEDTDINSSVDKVYFLGFHWLRGTRVIDVKMCINRLVYHTSYLRHLDTFQREVSRASSILLNGKNGRAYFCQLFPDVMHTIATDGDFPVYYLPGNVPPSTKAAVMSRRVAMIKLSLVEQLDRGYYTR